MPKRKFQLTTVDMYQPTGEATSNPLWKKRGGDRVTTVNSKEKGLRGKCLVRRVWIPAPGAGIFVWLSFIVLACGSPALAQQLPIVPGMQTGPSAALGTAAPAGEQPTDQRLTGSISGTVANQSGGHVLAPYVIGLAAATVVPDARAVPSQAEAGENQSNDQKTQHAIGVVPNLYVAYGHNVVPLTRKQKFEIAWKWTVDPVTFGLTGAIAGVQQAQNNFSEYGQGAQGYAKRYGAAYAGIVTGTFIGGAILPSLLKQDPRYFYKGSGSKQSRFLYAIANSVICKGDNGRWQTNYSNILGNVAAGGISNLYYPAQNRHGAALTFDNALFGIGITAALNVVQEFFTRKSSLPDSQSSKP